MFGGGGLSALGRGAPGGGVYILPLNIKDVAPPPTWRRMATHATSAHSALWWSHPTTVASGMTMAAVKDPSPSPVPSTPVCTR